MAWFEELRGAREVEARYDEAQQVRSPALARAVNSQARRYQGSE